MTSADAQRLAAAAAHTLGEHMQSVVILASYRNENDGSLTQMVRRGSGDWFAQQGMLHEELLRTRNIDLSYEIAARAKEARGE